MGSWTDGDSERLWHYLARIVTVLERMEKARAEPPAPRCTCPPASPRFLERHGEHDPACPAAKRGGGQ